MTASNLPALRARFAELFTIPAPPGMRAPMLAAAIAWQEQVLAHGDVAPALARDLAIIADETRSRRKGVPVPGDASASTAAGPAPLPPASAQLRPGARLVRSHGGVVHVVEVTAEGFLYQDQLYGSLSAVAKVITGTHWNGLLFFGLRRRRTPGGSTSAKRKQAAPKTRRVARG